MATPEEMAASMLANLESKTGAPLEHWLRVLAESGLEKHGALVKHLKTEHGMTHGYANLVAHESRRAASDDAAAEDDPVAAQYAGKKAALRPVYDAVLAVVRDLGGDVEVSPKKTYVSLRRSKQFALVKPSTATRVDLGLKLGDTEPEGRLEASGSFNAMVSHRVRLTAPADVDDEVAGWLRTAYEEA